jgi:flagellar motility protein MotE (MotC chaperone)
MLTERLKIFPLLIFVAMLAFSVRLVEIVSGVEALTSGSAFAEDTAAPAPDPSVLAKPGDKALPAAPPATAGATAATTPETPAPEATAEAKPDGEVSAMDKPTGEKPAEPVKAKDVKKPAQEIIWKDAADSDVDSADSVKMEMYQDLSKRRDLLDSREKDLQTREALIKAAEQELDRKYQELDTIRGEIKGLLKEQSEEEQKRIGALVKIYESMKPKEAANIFHTLDSDILVEVMTQMSERKLAPVLAAMDADRARAVTIIMAEQKKLPGLPDSGPGSN